MNFRSISLLSGQLITALAIATLIPLFMDLIFFKGECIKEFSIAFSINITVGIALILSTYTKQQKASLNMKEALIFTILTWCTLPFFAAIPFYKSISISYTDAYFEAASAITTTGTSIIQSSFKPCILLWRSILQWLGGTGIVVMALTFLPVLRVGGMPLLRTEFSDRSEKVLPRVSQVASGILKAYTFFTISCWVLLMIAGMPIMEACCHAMATVSTGGIILSKSSFSPNSNVAIEAISIIFMIIGSSTFMLFIRWWQNDQKSPLRDPQLRFYLLWIVTWTCIMASWHAWQTSYYSIENSLKSSLFNVVSLASSTGFLIDDNIVSRHAFPQVIMIILMLIGGCTGSTSGGIKIFRLQILLAVLKTHFKHIRLPHSVAVPIYDHNKISDFIISSTLSFLIVYVITFVVLALALAGTGLDLGNSFLTTAATLSNTGPTLTLSQQCLEISDFAKWLISFGMIVGRLEFITVLVAFTPSFWRS